MSLALEILANFQYLDSRHNNNKLFKSIHNNNKKVFISIHNKIIHNNNKLIKRYFSNIDIYRKYQYIATA